MSTSSLEIHHVSQVNAALLDCVAADVFDQPISPELLRSFLANEANQLVVAVVDGTVVGMASGIASVHPDKPLSLFINEVGVSEMFHRRGIGRKLVSALIQRGKDLGCVEAWVATEIDNLPARALYESLGGVPDQENAIVYVYSLSEQRGAGAPADAAASPVPGPRDTSRE